MIGIALTTCAPLIRPDGSWAIGLDLSWAASGGTVTALEVDSFRGGVLQPQGRRNDTR